MRRRRKNELDNRIGTQIRSEPIILWPGIILDWEKSLLDSPTLQIIPPDFSLYYKKHSLLLACNAQMPIKCTNSMKNGTQNRTQCKRKG